MKKSFHRSDLARSAWQIPAVNRLLARRAGRAVLHVQGRRRRHRAASGRQPPLDPKATNHLFQTEFTPLADAAANEQLGQYRTWTA